MMIHVEHMTPIVKLSLKLLKSDAYILVKGLITAVEKGAKAAAIPADKNNKEVTITKLCSIC